jgi:hypothetical protein
MGGGMRLPVEAVTPDAGLRVEVVEIAEDNPRPEARLEYTDRALDFAFGLWGVGIPLAK